MLIRVQQVREAFDALAADQNQLRLAWRLELSEKLRPRVEDLRWDGGAAAPAELVAHRHGRAARTAHEVLCLIHELLLGLGLPRRLRRWWRDRPARNGARRAAARRDIRLRARIG